MGVFTRTPSPRVMWTVPPLYEHPVRCARAHAVSSSGQRMSTTLNAGTTVGFNPLSPALSLKKAATSALVTVSVGNPITRTFLEASW